MTNRLITAMVLSILVMVLFNIAFPPKKMAVQLTQDKITENIPIENSRKTHDEAPKALKYEDIKAEEKTTVVETSKIRIVFSNIGGCIKEIQAMEYGNPILISLEKDGVGCLNSVSLGMTNDERIYAMKKEGENVIYSYEEPSMNISIRKEYAVDASNSTIKLIMLFSNDSGTPIPLDYTLTGPRDLKPAEKIGGRGFIEVASQINGQIHRKQQIRNNEEEMRGIIAWTGIRNRYFGVVMKGPREIDRLLIKKEDNALFGIYTAVSNRIIPKNGMIVDAYMIYAGPIIKNRLSATGMGIEGIENYGAFGFISGALLSLLGIVQKVFRNWGIAIILVTVIINIVLFPLTKISFKSMQRVQELQPHMDKLRQIHKDDPQRMNKEMMELYKKYNVNPFGGCLPMLLQLPIFIAFYQALIQSIELKNAGFLWIKDLAGPDAFIVFKTPLPLIGYSLNILPIITLVVMVVQQKLSMSSKNMSEEMRKQQKMMSIFFPIFFAFILYNFPSGLVLYWLTNSLLMAFEQYILKKNSVALVEA